MTTKEEYETWAKKHESNIACIQCNYPRLIDKLDVIAVYVMLFGGFGLFMWALSLNPIR